MAERTLDRMHRILVMVPWVIANPDSSVEEVCERFGLTREELSEDIDLLMICGLPPFGPGDLIEATLEGGRVSIRMADYLDRPPRLTRGEAVGLLVAGRALLALPGTDDAGPLGSALDKLAGAISPAEAQRAQQMAERVAVELDAGGAELLADVRAATAERARMRIAYFSAGRGEMTEREIDPLIVFNAMGNWYVVAVDHASSEERTFRVDRIRDATRTGEGFELPPGFDPAAYADGPLFVPSAHDREVVIEARPEAAWLAEFVPTERADDTARGVMRIVVRTAHLAWLVQLLLQAGASARAVRPPELVDAVRETAQAALARYSA